MAGRRSSHLDLVVMGGRRMSHAEAMAAATLGDGDIAEGTGVARRALVAYEKFDSMHREMERLVALSRAEPSAGPDSVHQRRRASGSAHPPGKQATATHSPSGAQAQGRGDDWDAPLEDGLAEGAGRVEMEDHFVAACRPGPCDVRLLTLLGPDAEAMLVADYERIFEYFHGRQLAAERQQLVGANGRRPAAAPADDSAATDETGLVLRRSTAAPEGPAGKRPTSKRGRKKSDVAGGATAAEPRRDSTVMMKPERRQSNAPRAERRQSVAPKADRRQSVVAKPADRRQSVAGEALKADRRRSSVAPHSARPQTGDATRAAGLAMLGKLAATS